MRYIFADKPIVELKMEPSNIVKAVDKINVTLLCDVASGNPDTLVEVSAPTNIL